MFFPRAFEEITRNKSLIIGRKTLLEGATQNFDHVAHCRKVVVVSQTLRNDEMMTPNLSSSRAPSFLVASSLEEAIRLAQTNNDGSSETTVCRPADMTQPTRWFGIDCWIGGGEGIYTQALKLPQAHFVHLTVMNIQVPVSAKTQCVARFPPHSSWQSNYRLVEQIKHLACDPLSFVTNIYKRIPTVE